MTHFTKLIENPTITIEDLNYPEKDTGNNPIMIAAKLRHKDLVSSILRSNKFEACDNDFLANLIHSRNLNGDTLLHTVALQGNHFLIARKIIQVFCSGQTLILLLL